MTKAKQCNKQKLPPGWTQARLRKLARYYDNQSDEEQVAEHETALQARGQTVMVVPTKLVPKIVALIARTPTAKRSSTRSARRTA